jgi:hypothetical protein
MNICKRDKGKLIQNAQKHTSEVLAEVLNEAIKPKPLVSGMQLPCHFSTESRLEDTPGSPSFPIKVKDQTVTAILRARWGSYSITCELKVLYLDLLLTLLFAVPNPAIGHGFLEQFLSGATQCISQVTFGA